MKPPESTPSRSLADITSDRPGSAASDPCPECFPDRPDARVRYRCDLHAPHPHACRCDLCWSDAVAEQASQQW